MGLIGKSRLLRSGIACSLCVFTLSLLAEGSVTVDVTTSLSDIYVSPSGDDSNTGTSASHPLKTIGRAVDVAKQNANIHIAPGMYRLAAPLSLAPENSNINFIGDSADSVIISGSVAITEWKQPTLRSVGPSVVTVNVSTLSMRHLYVNGLRARRARLDPRIVGKVFAGSKITEYGYAVAESPVDWIRSGTEFVYPQSTSPWTEPRCAVSMVNDTAIVMMQPCWNNLLEKACKQNVRTAPAFGNGYVENVSPKLISSPGEWSVDPSTSELSYALLPGETASTIKAEIPVLETLVVVEASYVRFSNVSFQYATWLRPGEADGFVEQQTGCCAIGTNPLNHQCGDNDKYWSVKSPGNVVVNGTTGTTFYGCKFQHLGGVGVDATETTNMTIDTCFFQDISGAGIQIGSFDDANAANLTVNNSVLNTIVYQAGAEYSGAAGINVGYTQGTKLMYNDVSNLSYVPISVGWGWARHSCWNCTNAANNTIAFNRAHDYKKTLNDGGGIYMLGPQNGSKIYRNWVYNQGTASSGALYPDEGSAYSMWFDNVVTDIGKSQWLHLWTSSIHNVTVENNFADTNVFLNHGTNCPMINNTVFPKGSPPPAAVAIMNASGVQNSPWMSALLPMPPQ